MPDRERKPGKQTSTGVQSDGKKATAAPVLPRPKEPKAAFDLWLERGLHKIFDDIAQEPIPDALLKIIEDDRNKK